MSISKLILGTAGLSGEPYGRSQKAVTLDEAVAVIQHAAEVGIRAFDTAPAYGFAEEALGRAKLPAECVVYTKTTGDVDELTQSIAKLGRVPTVLWHNYDDSFDLPKWVSGFSTYSDLSNVQDHVNFGRKVQVDWNILNQGPVGTMVRSVLLQGVLAGDPTPLTALDPYVSKAEAFAASLGLSLTQLSLAAALQNQKIRQVVVGATSIEEVDECVMVASLDNLNLYPAILALDVPDKNLTDPRKWTISVTTTNEAP
jgi:aryl-alcohol dehydrogenase-like predicted oxidoreductase